MLPVHGIDNKFGNTLIQKTMVLKDYQSNSFFMGYNGEKSGLWITNNRSRRNKVMVTIKEIEEAVSNLPSEKLAQFRVWFEEFDAKLWDSQFEKDVR